MTSYMTKEEKLERAMLIVSYKHGTPEEKMTQALEEIEGLNDILINQDPSLDNSWYAEMRNKYKKD